VSPTGLSPPLAGHPRPFGYAPDSYPLGAAAAAPRGSYNPPYATPAGLARTEFRLAPVRSPLLGGSRLMSFPPGTEMFQFPGLPPGPYGFRDGYPGMTPGGLPHSGTRGSTPAGGSPRTFVAFHALHRPSAPRHPPCARCSPPPRPRATPSRRDRLTTTTLQVVKGLEAYEPRASHRALRPGASHEPRFSQQKRPDHSGRTTITPARCSPYNTLSSSRGWCVPIVVLPCSPFSAEP
jgi:hypothetical protein